MNDPDQVHYSSIIDRGDIQELRMALLRSIDHARKNSAELAECKAKLDGALGTVARLAAELERMKRTQVPGSDGTSSAF